MALMEYRRLQPELTLTSDSGTWQFKLPRTGLINSLVVRVEITNGSTSCKDEDVYDALDRIEIYGNGNRVLYSLTGQQARLWTHTFLGHRPPYVRDENASAVQEAFIFIPFGLFPNDPNHYLDMQIYQDLELRITYSPTIAATSFATGTTIVSVYANMWRGVPQGSNQGFLRTTEQTYFTSLASGDTIYDLPLQNPWYAMGLYVYEAGIDPQTNIDDFELRVNNGEFSLFNLQWEVANQLFSQFWGIDPTEHGRAFKSDTDTIETRTGTLAFIGLDRHQAITAGTTDPQHDVVSGYAGGQATLQTYETDGATTASDADNTTDGVLNWFARAKFGLGNFVPVPFRMWLDGADFLNSNAYSRVQAIMTNGNAGAEVRLSLVELVSR